MASAITHAFVGAALASAAPRALPRARLALLLAVLAAVPDLDVIGLRLGIPYAHALGHRGFSHSLVFALLIGSAAAFALFRRTREARGAAAALAVAATVSHGLLDGLTDGGLGIGFFIPFDMGRYFFPWRPLPTSPLSVGAFFGARGVAILAQEVVRVWLPSALLAGLLLLVRRRARAC